MSTLLYINSFFKLNQQCMINLFKPKNCKKSLILPCNISVKKSKSQQLLISSYFSTEDSNNPDLLRKTNQPNKTFEKREINHENEVKNTAAFSSHNESVDGKADSSSEKKDESQKKESMTEEDYEKEFWDKAEQQKKLFEKRYQEYPDHVRYNKVYNNPIERTVGILKDDFIEFYDKVKLFFNPSTFMSSYTVDRPNPRNIFPDYCDVVIVGGGIVGTLLAYFLQTEAKSSLKLTVIEKDLTYSKASTVLSVGGFRQQFSLPENILLSRYGVDFLQTAKSTLAVEGSDPPNVGLTFNGYLTLASEQGYEQLYENYCVQKDHFAQVELLTKDKIKERFPWIETDGIEAGVYGMQREGWCDPWNFLLSANRKAKDLNSFFVNGEVIDSSLESIDDYVYDADSTNSMRKVTSIQVKLPNGEIRPMRSSHFIIASGAWSRDVGYMFGIGTKKEGLRSYPIPVEPRKRYVYCVHSPNGPGLNCPLVINPDGSYFRREGLGDMYLCGRSPEPEEEPPADDLSVDHQYFEEKVWPSIAHRCPSFNNLKVRSAWAGYYDYNYIDQNALIGRHPLYQNLYMCTGFSGHGLQQAAGAAKAVSTMILDPKKLQPEVERFGFERIVMEEPLFEKCIY